MSKAFRPSAWLIAANLLLGILATPALGAFINAPTGHPEASGGTFTTLEDIANTFENAADGAGDDTGIASTGGSPATQFAYDSSATGEQTGLAAGNRAPAAHVWGQFFGSAAHQGERQNVNGFEAGTMGFAFGADTAALIQHFVLGMGLSYSQTGVKADDVNASHTLVNTYQASLYADYDLGNHAFLRGMETFGFNTNETSRYKAGGTTFTADGKFDADEFTTLVKAGKRFDYAGAAWTPSVLARWVNFDPQNYTETGAGINDMNVRQQSVNVVELGLGCDVSWKHRDDDGTWLVPGLHAGYRYAVVDDRVETTSSFTGFGGTFTTMSPTPGRNRLNAGAGLGFYAKNGFELRASYDLDWREQYLANSGLLRATMRF
jgi:outer membrane autotransporter protein